MAKRGLTQLRTEIGVMRRDKPYTQVEIANIIGVDRRTVQHYETGTHKVPIWFVYALAYFYNIDHKTIDTTPNHQYNPRRYKHLVEKKYKNQAVS